MRDRDFERLGRQLQRDLAIPSVKGPLLFFPPVEHVLRGVYFEGSSSDRDSFYAWVFVQPLFVPSKHFSFSLGRRVLDGTTDRWQNGEADLLAKLANALRRQALPMLRDAATPRGVVELASSLAPSNHYVRQASAYCRAFYGDVAGAKEELQVLHLSLSSDVPWQREMAERAKSLSALLEVDVERAHQQLETWEAETLRNLKLEPSRPTIKSDVPD